MFNYDHVCCMRVSEKRTRISLSLTHSYFSLVVILVKYFAKEFWSNLLFVLLRVHLQVIAVGYQILECFDNYVAMAIHDVTPFCI